MNNKLSLIPGKLYQTKACLYTFKDEEEMCKAVIRSMNFREGWRQMNIDPAVIAKRSKQYRHFSQKLSRVIDLHLRITEPIYLLRINPYHSRSSYEQLVEKGSIFMALSKDGLILYNEQIVHIKCGNKHLRKLRKNSRLHPYKPC